MLLKAKLLGLFLFFKCLATPGYKDKKANPTNCQLRVKYSISLIGTLPPEIDEASGLIYSDTSGVGYYYFINDGGGKTAVYQTNSKLQIQQEIPIPKSQNHDWEEISSDTLGTIYIGDIGNNFNNRRNLCIYKYKRNAPESEQINFHYADQKAFPPVKKNRNFDCEAFFYFQDSLYLFSKNRGQRMVNIYTLPTVPGNYTAQIRDSTYLNEQITGACINKSETAFALLAYGKIYLFEVRDKKISFDHPLCFKWFPHSGQAEGISFINETDLMVCAESRKVFLIKRR